MPNTEVPGVDGYPLMARDAAFSEPSPSSSHSAYLAPRTQAAWRWLPLALLALAPAGLLVDCSLAQWFPQRHYPRLLADLIEVCEPFGNGLGVLILVGLIYQLDTERRWALPRVLACSLGAGMVANVIKMLIARTRPGSFDFEGGVLATFSQWLPLGSGGAAAQSFPSAHTATAFGLAVVLGRLYPSGRSTFGVLAAVVALQRMQSSSHYLTDILVGAAVGIVVARACLDSNWLASRFERWESRLKQPPADLPRNSDPASHMTSKSRAA